MNQRHTANLLGAVTTAIAGMVEEAAAEAAETSVSEAAALSAMQQLLTRPSVDQLAQVLGLTHSGSVRLVDRLVSHGLAARGPGPDGRTRAVTLTSTGSAAAARVNAARMARLTELLDTVGRPQVDALHVSLELLARAVVAHKSGGPWSCRLCDANACQRDRSGCPIAKAGQAKQQGKA